MSKSSKPNWKPSICFVALNAYNVLSGLGDLNHIGGAEVQQLRIASWLARRGYPVRFITLDHGQLDGINIDGITVRKAYAEEDGIRGLRFVHPRWSGLWSAMARADADVYYQRGADCQTGQVALWCRLHRRRFIFAVASESDCDSSLYALDSWREKTLYRVGLRRADMVIAQTETQQHLLQREMRVSACLVRNCGSNSADSSVLEQPATLSSGSNRVLWVGRISKEKRLEWLLDVAEQCPEITFEVVGAQNTTSAYGSSLIKRAASIPNVCMHGSVPHTEMGEYYQRCAILCCTSAYEGFPGAFLEAWSMGNPVVSTFDPDDVISENGLGWVAHDVKGIVTCLRRINQSSEIWGEASKAARQYYRANHTPEACLPAFERLLRQVVECEAKQAR